VISRRMLIGSKSSLKPYPSPAAAFINLVAEGRHYNARQALQRCPAVHDARYENLSQFGQPVEAPWYGHAFVLAP
jgi:hypothetical protein